MWNYQACKVILACPNIQQETESARLNERRQLAREVLQQRDLEGIPRYFEPISGFPRLGSDLQEITRLPWTQWTGVCKPGSFEGIWKAIGDQTYVQENSEAIQNGAKKTAITKLWSSKGNSKPPKGQNGHWHQNGLQTDKLDANDHFDPPQAS